MVESDHFRTRVALKRCAIVLKCLEGETVLLSSLYKLLISLKRRAVLLSSHIASNVHYQSIVEALMVIW